MRLVSAALALVVVVAATPASAQQASPLIDNERVAVWDLRVEKGTPAPVIGHDFDTVVMILEGGKIASRRGAGAEKVATYKFGNGLFVAKGDDLQQILRSGTPAREIVIALKDAPSLRYPNKTGLPPAFPRPGATKVLENARVVLWRYAWTPGKPTPMHFHDKDVVVAYHEDGALKSTTPDGAETVNAYKSDDIRFNRGDRAHSELLTTEHQSAMMVELK